MAQMSHLDQILAPHLNIRLCCIHENSDINKIVLAGTVTKKEGWEAGRPRTHKSRASRLLDRTNNKDLSVGMAKWNNTNKTFGWLVGCAQKQELQLALRVLVT